jgi:hypothetical protein
MNLVTNWNMGKYFIWSWVYYEDKGGGETWVAMAEAFPWSSSILSL